MGQRLKIKGIKARSLLTEAVSYMINVQTECNNEAGAILFKEILTNIKEEKIVLDADSLDQIRYALYIYKNMQLITGHKMTYKDCQKLINLIDSL